MTTTMLDALLDEAENLRDAQISIEVAMVSKEQRFEQLIRQIRRLRDEARASPPSILSTATVQEFQEFQASYFPYRAVLDQPSPGILPAAQDDEQGKHGSDAPVPGADMAESAESEQGVAEAASEEREAPRVEPEAAPEPAKVSNKDIVLDLYASTGSGPSALSRAATVPISSVENYLRQARRDGDARVAKGDLLREEQEVKETPAPVEYSKPYEPPLRDEDVPQPGPCIDPAPGADLVDLNLHQSTLTYRGQTIVLTKTERQILIRLNNQLPSDAEPLLTAASVLTGRSLDREISKLNGRLGAVDLEIHKDKGGLYTFRRVLAEF